MTRRPRAVWILAGAMALLLLAAITAAAVVGSSLFAIEYVRAGAPAEQGDAGVQPGPGSPGP